jgi:DNA repair protein RecO (recombination protein O)
VAVEHTEAVVVRGVDYSQTSRIVTFVTPKRGRVACLVKGARRPGSAAGAALDTFNWVEIGLIWKDSRAVQTLTDCYAIDAYPAIKGDLDKSACGAIALEIASRTAHENEPSEALFAALVQGLHGLAAWNAPAEIYACRMLLWLLAAAGFAPMLDQDCFTGEPLSGACGFSLDGGVTRSGSKRDCDLTAGEQAMLAQLAGAGECPRGGGDAAKLLRVLSAYTERQMDFTLRSARVFEQLRTKAGTVPVD